MAASDLWSSGFYFFFLITFSRKLNSRDSLVIYWTFKYTKYGDIHEIQPRKTFNTKITKIKNNPMHYAEDITSVMLLVISKIL